MGHETRREVALELEPRQASGGGEGGREGGREGGLRVGRGAPGVRVCQGMSGQRHT